MWQPQFLGEARDNESTAMRQESCAAAGEALPVETTAATPDATIREGEMEGALRVVGELGYRAASVRAVLEYSGGHRKQFYEHFDSLKDCFAQAYGAWVDRLGMSLIEVTLAADGWRASVRAGMVSLSASSASSRRSPGRCCSRYRSAAARWPSTTR